MIGGALALAALGVVLAVGLSHRPSGAASPTGLVVSTPGFARFAAPKLPSRTLDGRPFALASYRGRPVAVVFFASWCTPCRREAPALAALSRRPGGPALVGVAMLDQAGDARRFARRFGWRFPVVGDPDGSYAARFDVAAPPTTMVVDGKGSVVQAVRGGVDGRTLDALVKSATGA
jgi:cytochrome c biogenesis protein CcmG/thiol:disulfide interchange protein DsbE